VRQPSCCLPRYLITKGLGEGLIAFPYLAIPYAYLQYREAGTRGNKKTRGTERTSGEYRRSFWCAQESCSLKPHFARPLPDFCWRPPPPRYGIPPYLITQDLEEGFIPFPYLIHTVCIPPIPHGCGVSWQEQPTRIFRAVTAAAKWIVRVSAHKLIMRGQGEIIGKVGQRNFANVFRGLGVFCGDAEY
jgi:hypothetical protein